MSATKKQTAKGEAANRVVLVGTYRKGQLQKWRGWYNYPISEKDTIPERDFAKVNELWLFLGTKAQKTYAAEFVGVKTREALIKDYGYPAKGKGHAEKYLLFKTAFKYLHQTDNPLDCEKVIIRLRDFSRSPKVRKQLREYLALPERHDPMLTNMLPRIVLSVPPAKLCVCEAAVQYHFQDWTPGIYTSPLLDKIESIVMSIGEFGRAHAIPSSAAYAYLKKFKGIEYLDNYHMPLSCFPIESLVEDLAQVCRNNGGNLK